MQPSEHALLHLEGVSDMGGGASKRKRREQKAAAAYSPGKGRGIEAVQPAHDDAVGFNDSAWDTGGFDIEDEIDDLVAEYEHA
jgi:hypothetical protein